MRPFFSICIPQYNRTSFLLLALERLRVQSFQDFEICIADDCSPDQRQQEIIHFLEQSGMRFRFEQNASNLRYDGNLRASLRMSSGKYCLMMGNDDGLASSDTLQELKALIDRCNRPLLGKNSADEHTARENGGADKLGVLIQNYREPRGSGTADAADGQIVRRIREDALCAGTPDIAAGVWRDFSFISGIVFDGDLARSLDTAAHDGTEYYQLFLGSKIIASGKLYCASTMVAVDKDLQVEGESVDSYAKRKRQRVSAFHALPSTQAKLVDLVCAGIHDYGTDRALFGPRFRALAYLYCFTMPYWILEYRRVQSWSYASALALGMRPRYAMKYRLGMPRRFAANLLWSSVYLGALLCPLWLFFAVKPWLYSLAKRTRPKAAAGTSAQAAYDQAPHP